MSNHHNLSDSELVIQAEQAREAYERYVHQLRARADILDDLLGELGYYGGLQATIVYRVHVSDTMPDQKAKRDVRELVDRYVAKRTAVYGG